jgi:type IV pilus assembly protein PilV
MNNNEAGFTIVEVLIALMIFTVAVLAVASMQISSISGNDRANIGSEAATLASDKLEELMVLNYDDAALLDTDGDGTNQDTDDDGVDDVAADFTFGLLDEDGAADFQETPIGSQGVYQLFWNIAIDEPLVNAKRITIIIRWTGGDGRLHRVTLNSVKPAFEG